MLKFKDTILVPAIQKEFNFLDAIKKGRKTQTIRYPGKCIVVGSLIHFGTPDGYIKLGKLRILSTYIKRFNQLTRAEVRADGFKSWHDFYQLMLVLDPTFNIDRQVLVIKFKYRTEDQIKQDELRDKIMKGTLELSDAIDYILNVPDTCDCDIGPVKPSNEF